MNNARRSSEDAFGVRTSSITIYADTSRADPWAGPLLATAFSVPSLLDEKSRNDVLVPAVGAGRQGSILGSSRDRLRTGTGIEMYDAAQNGRVSVLARGELLERRILALASHIVDAQGHPRLDATAVPAGYSVVYEGAVEPISQVPSLLRPQFPTFSVSATAGTGPPSPSQGLQWTGAVLDDATFEATRFFVPDPGLRPVGTKQALVWDTTIASGSPLTVARWREGRVVITAGIYGEHAGTRRKAMESLVTSMRRLDRDEWTSLTSQFSFCRILSTTP